MGQLKFRDFYRLDESIDLSFVEEKISIERKVEMKLQRALKM